MLSPSIPLGLFSSLAAGRLLPITALLPAKFLFFPQRSSFSASHNRAAWALCPGRCITLWVFLCHLLFRPLFQQEAGLVGVRRSVNRTPQDLASPLLVFLFPSLILAAVWGPGCTAVPIAPARGGRPPRSQTVSHLGPRYRVQPRSALLCQAYNRASAVPNDGAHGDGPIQPPAPARGCPQSPSQQEGGGKAQGGAFLFRCVEFALLLFFLNTYI